MKPAEKPRFPRFPHTPCAQGIALDPIEPRAPLNRRQERFCHAYVEYGCAAVAAATAGYSRPGARQQGYRLLRDARIRDRVAAIEQGLAGEADDRRRVLMGKLEVIYRRALQDHHFHAAARAVELQARLSGFATALRAPRPLDGDPGTAEKAVAGLLAPPAAGRRDNGGTP